MSKYQLAALLVAGLVLIVAGVWMIGGAGYALIVLGVGFVAVSIRREYD
jgi:hypothetical protein